MSDNRYPFGWNVNCIRLGPKTEDDVVALFDEHKPSLGVFRHGLGTAVKVKNILPTCDTIARTDYPDHTLHQTEDAKGYVRKKARLRDGGAGGVRHQILGEPDGSPEDILKWLCDVMDEADRLAVLVGVLNAKTNSLIQRVDVDRGLWDEFLHRAYTYGQPRPGKENPIVKIGFDDYCWGVIPIANPGPTANGDPNKGHWHWDMLDPSLCQPDRWPTKYEATELYWGAAESFMRWIWLAKRSFDKGWHFKHTCYGEVTDVPFFCYSGEGLLDRMPHWEGSIKDPYKGSRVNLIDRLDLIAWERGILPQGHKIHGPLDQFKMYPFWFPQWAPEDAWVEINKWVNSVVPLYWDGVGQFTLAFDEDLEKDGNISWDRRNFNYWRAENPFMKNMVRRRGEIMAAQRGYFAPGTTQPEPPIEEPPIIVNPPNEPQYPELPLRSDERWVKAVVTTSEGLTVELYEKPVESSELVGVVFKEEMFSYIDTPYENWYPVRTGQFVGWLETGAAVTIAPVVEAPPPDGWPMVSVLADTIELRYIERQIDALTVELAQKQVMVARLNARKSELIARGALVSPVSAN